MTAAIILSEQGGRQHCPGKVVYTHGNKVSEEIKSWKEIWKIIFMYWAISCNPEFQIGPYPKIWLWTNLGWFQTKHFSNDGLVIFTFQLIDFKDVNINWFKLNSKYYRTLRFTVCLADFTTGEYSSILSILSVKYSKNKIKRKLIFNYWFFHTKLLRSVMQSWEKYELVKSKVKFNF